MLAVRDFRPQKGANIIVNTPADPAQALIRRYIAWEKRLENLIEFFTLVQKFQKDHSRHYTALSEVVGKKLHEDEGFVKDAQGVLSIWDSLHEKSLTLARFFNGLHDSYNDTVLTDLKSQLDEVRQFKSEIHQLRTREGAKVTKKQKRFFDSVTDLKLSINRLRTPTTYDDPFIRSRKCKYYLQRWIERNNALKKHYSNIQDKCANFEYLLVPKLKATCRAHVALVQNQCQVVNDTFLDVDATFTCVAQGMDWQHFVANEPSLRTINGENDANNMKFENSDHELTIPCIVGEMEILNKFTRRYETSTFCVTHSGFLMRFEGRLEELRKFNIEPRWSVNLTRSVLGPLKKGRNTGSFALTAERFLNEGGRYRILKTPVTLAKHTMSTLTRHKFNAPIEEVEDWYTEIAKFARKGPGADDDEKRHKVNRLSCNRNSGPIILPSAQSRDVDSDDESASTTSRETALLPGHEHGEDEWEEPLYQSAEEEVIPIRIADLQPTQVVENPW